MARSGHGHQDPNLAAIGTFFQMKSREHAKSGRSVRRSKMAKYMLIMRGTDESVAKMMETPFEQMLETVGRFNEEMIRAGVLVAAEGLDDPSLSVVVDFSGETPVVTDGPYGETKELFGGFYVIDVASKEEAVEWAKRLPAVAGTKCEIRRVPSIDEFPQDNEWIINEWIIKERAWRESTGQLAEGDALGRGGHAGPVGRPAVGSRPGRRRRPRADVSWPAIRCSRPRPAWP